jgi:branched-subunit amino acid aminotransferase/4-amino-4-deoxychorismate lyase
LVIELANELAIPLKVEVITLQQLRNADVLFLTNAITGILPVKQFEGCQYDPSLIPEKLIQRVNKQLCG